MPRNGQTPLYPSYFDSVPRRVPAILEGHHVYIKNQGIYTVNSFQSLVELLFNESALCFVQSLGEKVTFPFLREAVRTSGVEVLSNEEGHPIGCRIPVKGRETRWIVPASTWDRALDETFLDEMVNLFCYFQLAKPTPGSYGQALMRRIWREFHLPYHTAPNSIAHNFLRAHGVGGRCDTCFFRI